MAVFNWVGGTTAVTHVMTGTFTGAWDSPDTVTTTMIDEGGSAQAVQSTSTGTTEETQTRDVHLTALQNSQLSMFLQCTFTASGVDKIIYTAKVSGRPLSGGVATNDVTTTKSVAGSGDYAIVETTANAGPNDGNTNANWIDGGGSATTSPTGGANTTKFLPHPTDVDLAGNPVSYNLTYGLDHSSVAINELRFPRSYRGIVGDPANKFFFHIDVTNGTPVTVIDSSSASIWLKGDHTEILVVGVPRGEDALHLHGGTIATIRILGSRVLGKITFEDGSIVTTLESIGAGMTADMGTSGTVLGSAYIDGGQWTIDRAVTTLNTYSGVVWHTKGLIATATNHGALVYFNSSETITTLHNRSGIINFEQNVTNGITITDPVKIWSGRILDKSGLKNVNYAQNIIVYGGIVTTETGSTQSQT